MASKRFMRRLLGLVFESEEDESQDIKGVLSPSGLWNRSAIRPSRFSCDMLVPGFILDFSSNVRSRRLSCSTGSSGELSNVCIIRSLLADLLFTLLLLAVCYDG